MATAPKLTPYPHIEKTEGIRAGKACIEGTRIAVVDIVRLRKQGYQPEEMRDRFVRALGLAEVYAALLYYEDHPEEIDEYFEREEGAQAEYVSKRAEYLSRRRVE